MISRSWETRNLVGGKQRIRGIYSTVLLFPQFAKSSEDASDTELDMGIDTVQTHNTGKRHWAINGR
jgi:hypothetical protein